MAVLEGAEVDFFAGARDIGINAEEKILETVWVGFGMAAGVMSITTGAFAEEGWVFHQEFVGLFAVADPHLVGPFLVPDDGAFGAGELVVEPVLAAGKALGDGEGAAGAVVEFEEDVGVVFGVDGVTFLFVTLIAGVGALG